MARRFAVETAHTPIAINRVKAFADPLQDNGEFGLCVGGRVGEVGDGHAELVAKHAFTAGGSTAGVAPRARAGAW